MAYSRCTTGKPLIAIGIFPMAVERAKPCDCILAPPRISIDLYGCAIRPEPAKQHLKTKILLAERGSGFYGLPEAKRL